MRAARNSLRKVKRSSCENGMEQSPKFLNSNDNVINELRRVKDIDHVIVDVTEVAQRLSQEGDRLDNEDITPEPRVTEEWMSVGTDGAERRAKKKMSRWTWTTKRICTKSHCLMEPRGPIG